MTAHLAFVGRSGQGKTTILAKVVSELASRGWRVGVVKDAHHVGDVDKQGKDTYKLKQAGAPEVLLNSPGLVAFFQTPAAEPSLEELLSHFKEADFVLIEGFKSVEECMKIEVYRRDSGKAPLEGLKNLAARITDERFDDGVPSFGLEDAAAAADFILETLHIGRTAK